MAHEVFPVSWPASRGDQGHTSCSSLLEEPQGQLLLFGTPLDAVRDMVHRSDYQAIGEGYDRFGSLERSRPTVEMRDEDCLVQKYGL
jgi:hypothetical protein